MASPQANPFECIYYERLETIKGVRFTRREIDTIACLISGKATKSVARTLSIDEKTVETHKYNVMRKLECNTKEGIIDFIEKSDKFSVIKEHYLGLLTQSAFQKSLQETSRLLKKDNRSCSLVYWQQEGEGNHSFIKWLEKYLGVAGVKTTLEMQVNDKPLNHLVHKVGPSLTSYILYVLPASLFGACQGDNSKRNLKLLPFMEKHSQDSRRVIFLLADTPTPIPQEIEEAISVDFSGDNPYFPFWDILEKISPASLEKVVSGFKEQYGSIYGTSKASSQPWREEGNAAEGKEEGPWYRNVFPQALERRKLYLVPAGGIVLFSVFSTLFLMGGKPPSTPLAVKPPSVSKARSELPIPHGNALLERPGLISKINTQFKEGQQDIQSIALVGIGGSGKTVVARQYARRQDGIVWEANAETARSLKESFENLAYLLAGTEEEKKELAGLKDIRDPEEKEGKILLFVKERLKANPGWLLIFDNVGEFSDIEKHFPSDSAVWGKGRIMLTTRNGNMEVHTAIHHAIPVKELDPEEKLSLFLKIIHSGDMAKLTALEKEKTSGFLEALPPFPLDVSVAAYYLKATGTSPEEYIRNISGYKSGFDSVQGRILNEAGAYSNTRYKIITLSLEKMMKGSKDFGETLLFISLIGTNNIPRELLEKFKDPIVIDGFIHHLKKYSLATHSVLPEEPTIQCLAIHRSTQDIALAYLAKKLEVGKDKSLLKDISQALESYMDRALEEEDFLRMKVSAAHAEALTRHKEVVPDFTRGLIDSKLGCMYYFLNDQARAKKTIGASLPVLEDHLLKGDAEEEANVAQAFLHIGNVYTEISHYEEAKRILEKSLGIYNKTPSKDYVKVSWGLSHLANAYRRSGYYIKAKELLEESLSLQKQCSPGNQGRVARTLAYLGSVYRGLGYYGKAIEILHQSLSLYRSHFPEDHFRVGWVLCHLGNIYRKQGHYGKSIKILEEGLTIYRKRFSENHINVGLMLTYLGNSYKGLGNYEKARDLLEEGLRVHEGYFKPGHERIGRILYHLGNVYKELGDDEKSTRLFHQALSIYGNVPKKGKIEMARLFRNMGGIYLVEGRLEEAEKKLQESLEILKGHGHPETYLTLESLAELYVKKSLEPATAANREEAQRFRQEATRRLEQALEIMGGQFPQDSAHIEKIRAKMARIKEGAAL